MYVYYFILYTIDNMNSYNYISMFIYCAILYCVGIFIFLSCSDQNKTRKNAHKIPENYQRKEIEGSQESKY